MGEHDHSSDRAWDNRDQRLFTVAERQQRYGAYGRGWLHGPAMLGGDPMSRLILPGPDCPPGLDPDVWDGVLAYQPHLDVVPNWPVCRDLILDVIAQVATGSWAYVSRMLYAVNRFVCWAERQGVPLDKQRMFIPDHVDRYCIEVLAENNGVGTTRSVLARVGQQVVPDGWPWIYTVSSRKTLRAPYSAAQMLRWERLADAQPEPSKEQFLHVLIDVCAGAGATPGSARRLTGDDVFRADGLLWVRLTGSATDPDAQRDVPVLLRYADDLEARAAGRGQDHILGVNPTAKNSMADAIKATSSDQRGAGVSPQRLRTTWLIGRLIDGVPVPDLIEAAGLKGTAWVTDLIPYLPDSPDNLETLLAGGTGLTRLAGEGA